MNVIVSTFFYLRTFTDFFQILLRPDRSNNFRYKFIPQFFIFFEIEEK